MHGVEQEIPNEMCVSCGICKGVCKMNAISYERNEYGQYLPRIDSDKCVDCSLCIKCCPAIESNLSEMYENTFGDRCEDIFKGNCIACYSSHVKDREQLHLSTSGGVVTSLIRKLLSESQYECAFLVDSYRYDVQVLSRRKTLGDLGNTEKSRYIPVSHELLVRHMVMNRDEKIIIVSTPCVTEGIHKVIDNFHLKRENYLFIGLFCNATMNYNVWNYFEKFGAGEKINKLYFRSKDHNDWFYGAVVPVLEKSGAKYLHPGRRMLVKKYYTLKRCIFCNDKLNIMADIAVGDDNTKNGNGSSSSVIIRTERGWRAFETISEEIEKVQSSINEIGQSQQIKELRHHYAYNVYYNQIGGRAPLEDEMIKDIVPTAVEIKRLKKLLRKWRLGTINMVGFVYYLTRMKWPVLETVRCVKNFLRRG